MGRTLGLFIFLFWGMAQGASIPAQTMVSMAVGQVKTHVLTSREVHVGEAIEQVLYSGLHKSGIRLTHQVESPQFAKQVTGLLLEWVVYFEAKSMAVTRVSDSELSRARAKVQDALKSVEAWRRLEVSGPELDQALERKLMAKKLIQFRADSSVVPVSDADAEKYFNQNRLKFGQLPFDNFKTSIKTFLSRQQVERRLKDWFEVLQAKYNVRNFLSEI